MGFTRFPGYFFVACELLFRLLPAEVVRGRVFSLGIVVPFDVIEQVCTCFLPGVIAASLGKNRWVYLWADDIYSGLRAEDARLCALVVIGVNERGEKHCLAIEELYAKSAHLMVTAPS